MSRLAVIAVLGVLAVLAAACTQGSDEEIADAGVDAEPSTFIAYESNFQGFRDWTAVHSDGPPPQSVSIDVRGPRTQYLNMVPKGKLTEFPVGTIIVEAREAGSKLIFAAVKRGSGYNPTGAVNWEWFELMEDPVSGHVSIQWRGIGPPAGAVMYGGTDRCNTCHSGCADNDYACSAKLQLTDF